MANKFTAKALLALNVVINLFKNPDALVEKASMATFPGADMPSSNWTLRNRWLAMFQTGEIDCRGFRQWKQVGRNVKKGTAAAFILAPIMIPLKRDGVVVKDKQGKNRMICIGFKNVAVHSVNDTDGKALDYNNPEVINAMPLKAVADAWGIDVAGRPFVGGYFGFYSPGQDAIRVCTDDERVFFHELTHAAHQRLHKSSDKSKGLKGGQDPAQEIIAELGASVLARLYGKEMSVRKDSYNYIKAYADEQGKDVLDACLGVLSETAKVISLIMDTASEQGEKDNMSA